MFDGYTFDGCQTASGINVSFGGDSVSPHTVNIVYLPKKVDGILIRRVTVI
jgi:hypothetical protein